MAVSVDPHLDFLVVGCERSGSTWLHECLREHPDIYLPPEKEAGFFSRGFEKGWEYYRRRFSTYAGEKVVGAVEPSYFFGDKALGRVVQFYPDAKIMSIFRHPADRTYSLYWWLRNHGAITLPFWQALEEDPHLIDSSLYGKYWSRYCFQYPEHRRKALILEELKFAPKAGYREIFQFIGAAPDFVPASIQRQVNITGRHRSQKLFDWAMSAKFFFFRNGFSGLIGLARALGMHKLFYGISYARGNAKSPSLSEADRAALVERHFKDDLEAFYELLQRDVPAWKPEAMSSPPRSAGGGADDLPSDFL